MGTTTVASTAVLESRNSRRLRGPGIRAGQAPHHYGRKRHLLHSWIDQSELRAGIVCAACPAETPALTSSPPIARNIASAARTTAAPLIPVSSWSAHFLRHVRRQQRTARSGRSGCRQSTADTCGPDAQPLRSTAASTAHCARSARRRISTGSGITLNPAVYTTSTSLNHSPTIFSGKRQLSGVSKDSRWRRHRSPSKPPADPNISATSSRKSSNGHSPRRGMQ